MWFLSIYPTKLYKIINYLLCCVKVFSLLAIYLALNLYRSFIYKLVTYSFYILAQVLLYSVPGKFSSLVASLIYS